MANSRAANPHLINSSPLTTLLAEKKYLIIDGAMGTELESRGCQLNDKLWSAKVLLENPDLIYQVHLDYLRAGADFIITCSYQASVPGFSERGLSEKEALGLIAKSVEIAKNARADYLNEIGQQKTILIAGSVGPYATLLADGSEYRGDYDMEFAVYAAYHRPRIAALIDAGVDFLAFETVPSVSEVKALIYLLYEHQSMTAYISLSLRDECTICDGTPLTSFFDLVNTQPQIVAVGVNCIGLDKISDILKSFKTLTNRPILVYPNSGEQYEPVSKTWICQENGQQLVDFVDEWLELGAKMIGGCCRTNPKHIQQIAEKIQPLR